MGVRGSKVIASIELMERGMVSREDVNRQGVVPVVVLGARVRVVATERRT